MRWTILALSALAVITAAHAQPEARPGGWDAGAFWRGAPAGPRDRIRFLQDRIDRGRNDGSLDPREADRAQGELDGVRNWVRRMHYDDGGPMGPDQRAHVQSRLDQISRQIRWMRHDGW